MVAEIQKKFFDLDQNIFEILNVLKSIHSSKVIFIFPVDSVIFTGVVNLKIIDKYAKEHKIPLILVTEDSYGFKLAQKAGIVAVQKMSQITPDLWTVAERRAIVGSGDYSEDEHHSENLNNLEQNILEDNKRSFQDQNQLVNELPEQSSTEEVVEIESPVLSKYAKQKTVSGIEFFVGEDVKKNLSNSDIIEDMERTPTASLSKNMIGMDMGKIITKNSSKKRFNLNNLYKIGKSGTDLTESDSLALQKRKKKLVIAVVIFLLVIGATVFLISTSVTAEISLSFRAQSVDSSFTLLATNESEDTELNQDGVIQTQLFSYTANDVSISRTFAISRTSTVGEKAKGVITFYNLTESQLSIPVGTQITSTVGQKKYVVLQDVIIPAVEENPIGEKVPESIDNVPIEALSVGAEFNLSATSGDDKFIIQIAGFDDAIKANGRIFSNISGGSSREAYIVLQEDIDKAKEIVSQEVRKVLEDTLRTLIPRSQVEVVDSIKFGDIEFSTSPQVGEESVDQQFSLTTNISGEISSIDSDALTNASNLFFQANLDGESNEFELLSKDFVPSILKSTKSDTGIVFDIGFTGVVGVGLPPARIFELVKGKHLEEARRTLSELENIDRFSIQFKPGFIPEFLKIVPADQQRVLIRVN